MLSPSELNKIRQLIIDGTSRVDLRKEVETIRKGLNPHPAQQKELNVPRIDGKEIRGMQHKYRFVLFHEKTQRKKRKD